MARKELEARRDDARSFGDLIREAKEREKGWPEWMRQPIAPAKKQPSSGLESQPQH